MNRRLACGSRQQTGVWARRRPGAYDLRAGVEPGRLPGAALATWLVIVAHHGGISPRRWHRALPWLFRYTALEPARLWERLRYDGAIVAHQLPRDPIFVLGHWRSGTSLLQELLSLDPGHATCTLAQCLFPDVLLSFAGWLPDLMDTVGARFDLRYPIQDRPLRADLPAEEEIAMLGMTHPACGNWGQLFPSWAAAHVEVEAPRADSWLEGYTYLVNKLSLAHGGKRLVLKSPLNTARIPLLLEAYPGAQFVHIHRHPLEVFASCRHLWGMIQDQSALQVVRPSEVERLIKDGYVRLLTRYLADRRALPPHRLVEVRFDRLRADREGELGRVYRLLGLGEIPRAEIARFEADVPAPPPRPRNLDGALEQDIRRRWKFAFDAWHYV